MAKKFYTEKDIEDLFKNGVLLLEAGEDVVLTELAYEKAQRLGMKLILGQAENPPCAPVRPYISRKLGTGSLSDARKDQLGGGKESADLKQQKQQADLKQRIRAAVLVQLGSQVDETLLETIIQRVMSQTGLS